MEDNRAAIKLLQKDFFMATLDLKEAYFLIPIYASHKKYLRFEFDSQFFEFQCIPFGLCTAPFVFTKTLKPVVATLRSRGFLSVIYLDDFFLMARSLTACKENLNQSICLLESLGFVISYEKSQLLPTQRCRFLGFFLNSSSMTLELPSENTMLDFIST